MNTVKLLARIGLVAVMAMALIALPGLPGAGSTGVSYAEAPGPDTDADATGTAESIAAVIDRNAEDVGREQISTPDGIATIPEQVNVDLEPVGDSGVSGEVTLTALGDGTDAFLEVTGLGPGAIAQSSLHAGTCDQPSASFAPMPELTADDAGNATAIGPAVQGHGDRTALNDDGRQLRRSYMLFTYMAVLLAVLGVALIAGGAYAYRANARLGVRALAMASIASGAIVWGLLLLVALGIATSAM